MFKLDIKLQADTFFVYDFEMSSLFLMNDANYLWLILVPRKPNLSELIDLDFASQTKVLKEINIIAKILKDQFKADKLNIANLGNVVKQLHIHIIARYENDITFPKPVWGQVNSKPYQEKEVADLIKKIQSFINSDLSSDLSQPLHLRCDSVLIKQLSYRSTHRGCKETDILLGNFFSERHSYFNQAELNIYCDFIEEDDLLIYDWILGKDAAPEKYDNLITQIRTFHKMN